MSRGFTLGGYKCECRQGYEYPFADEASYYFEGFTVDKEYQKMLDGKENLYGF